MVAVPIATERTPAEMRALARRERDGRVSARLLALAGALGGMSRAAAARAAGEIGEERAVPALTDLIDDPALPVRLAAIKALGEIGGEEARDALIYALEDKREEIREAAEEALETLDFFDDPLAP